MHSLQNRKHKSLFHNSEMLQSINLPWKIERLMHFNITEKPEISLFSCNFGPCSLEGTLPGHLATSREMATPRDGHTPRYCPTGCELKSLIIDQHLEGTAARPQEPCYLFTYSVPVWLSLSLFCSMEPGGSFRLNLFLFNMFSCERVDVKY